MPQIRIFTIYSRWQRFCLISEDVFRPMGLGFSMVIPVNVARLAITPTHGWMLVVTAGFIILGPILLTIGLWRPMHQRLGIKRGDYWRAP